MHAGRSLTTFRSAHIMIVQKYVVAEQERLERAAGLPLHGGKGTGGTAVMDFLKPLRDATRPGA